jgi:ribosomal-protein-alanine N-acetyltransferase
MSMLRERPPVISIRQLGPEDAGPVAALHAGVFPRPWGAEEFRRLLTGTGTLGLAAHLPTEDDYAGFALARTVLDEAEILTLGVRPERRRLGYAGALLAALANRAARRGCLRLYLEVAEDNHPALGLYRAHGFRQVGRRPDYYRLGDGSTRAGLVLARPVSAPADV